MLICLRRSALDYQQRILNAPLWNDTKDLCKWDLSPEGATELNSWVRVQPGVYYFSGAAFLESLPR